MKYQTVNNVNNHAFLSFKSLTVSQYAALLGVHPQTLRRYERENKVPCLRTIGNHRRFSPPNNNGTGRERIRVGYARVSSHDQKSDLLRQCEDIKARANPDVVVSDVAGGVGGTE